jgi:gliding motility-associated lipoprotein GldB
MKNIFLITFCCLLFFNCKKQATPKVDTSSIKINTDFINFHTLFYNSDSNKLASLKQSFPYLFPSNIKDEVWVSKMQNKEEKILYKMVDSAFGDFKLEEKKITNLFKHIKHYKPLFTPPKVITLITNLDYDSKVIYADSLLLISLDMYLGKKAEVYSSFPSYISNNYTPEHLIVDIAKSIAKKEFSFVNGRSFLESMIFYGKELFLLQSLIPNSSQKEIIGYEDEKYNWTIQNESEIWSYFITEKLLYSTDKKLNIRFINNAPFSKFYLDTDMDSPGRIGTWIGWKIVQSFMKNNNVSLQEMLLLDTEVIFRKSKYKPKK